jgi:hypothetical protein
MRKKELETIGKCLVQDLPIRIAVKGPLSFYMPIGHTLRGIYLAGSIEPRGFYAQLLLQPLCVPVDVIGFNVGWRLGGGCHRWNADAPDMVEKLNALLKREALPFLSAIQTPRDVAEAAESLERSADPIVSQAIAYARARAGDIQRATTDLDRFIQLVATNGYWQEEIKRAESLKAMLCGNPAEAQRQLEAWENQTAKSLGLEKFR